jgi:HemY protein
MIRVFLYLVLVCLAALAVVWLADRPGDVAVTWQGWRIETSVMVAAVALAVVMVATVAAWSIFRAIVYTPSWIAMYLSHRRGVRGYLAITRGLIAIGAGDLRDAQRAADEAKRIAQGEPLTLLLDAQNAQLSGDKAAAEQAFRAMTERPDTRILGLRGLYIEAQRRGDITAARAYAEQAADAAPALGWAGQAVLEFRCAASDWRAAQSALDRNRRYGLIGKSEYRRQRAVLLTAQALAAEDDDRDRARALALEAVKLEPSLVPAAELAGRLLGEAGELRRAGRIIEKAWQAHPHPDLAETYTYLRPGDAAKERLARAQFLARRAPGHAESALAVARAALEAQQFTAARNALKPLLQQPTQRAAMLMAEIERRENADEGRAREWMARALRALRDPAWTADGFVSDRWMPVSPISGRLDAFEWKIPITELGPRHDDDNELGPFESIAAAAPASPTKDAKVALGVPEVPVVRTRRAAAPAQAVLPLMPVPDDPGPEPAPDSEPEAGAATGSPGLRLFK